MKKINNNNNFNSHRQNYRKNYRQNGFIALISVIIVNLILLIIILSVHRSGFISLANVSDNHYKNIANYASEACARKAIFEIASNGAIPADLANSIEEIDTDIVCTIKSASKPDSNYIIKTQAVFNDAYSNYEIEIHPTSFKVLSWIEIPIL